MNTYPDIVAVKKDELQNYPTKAFDGKIIVVSELNKVDAAVQYLSTKKTLGFDTETRPSFTKKHYNSVALLQLSDETNAFLFRLNKIGLPASLAQLLENNSIIKVGVAVHDDIKALQKLTPFNPNKFIDLQDIAKELHIEAMGLRNLTPIALGFRISKRQQLSNWENIYLSKAQRLYAATDAWVSLRIYQQLLPYTL